MPVQIIYSNRNNTDPRNKGFYADISALNTTHATALDGDFAVVGTTDTIWVWDTDTTTWIDSGLSNTQTALDDKVDKIVGKGLSENDYTDEDKALVTTAVQPETLVPQTVADATERKALTGLTVGASQVVQSDVTGILWTLVAADATLDASWIAQPYSTESDGTIVVNLSLPDVTGIVPAANTLGVIDGDLRLGNGVDTGGRPASGIIRKVLAADKTVYNDTTLAELFPDVPLSVGFWKYSARIIASNNSGAGIAYKLQFSSTEAANRTAAFIAYNVSNSGSVGQLNTSGQGAIVATKNTELMSDKFNGAAVGIVEGLFEIVTAANFTSKFAQVTATAYTVSLQKMSYIEFTKIA